MPLGAPHCTTLRNALWCLRLATCKAHRRACSNCALQKQNFVKKKKRSVGNVCAAMVSNFHWCSGKHAKVLRREHTPCFGGAVQGLWVAVFGQFHQLASMASPAMHGASALFFSMAMLCFALASWAFVPPHLKLYFI